MAEMRAETRYAKQMFLHGDGNGAPVRNVARLSELSGVSGETIRKHLPEWEKEAAQLLASSSEVGLALVLSEEKLDQHSKDSAFMRNQLDKLKFEIETLEKMAVRLGEWMDKFDGDQLDQALQIFDAWQRATGTESSLRGQFIAMKKLWDQKVGIDALQDIGMTRQKEIAKGQGKLAVKQMEAETGPTTRNVGASGVFARPSDAGKVKALDA
jgi:hypothetical protein